MLKVFEAFSGYGSQSLALERLNIPHEVVCISEIDKYAIQAYEALHGATRNLGDISKINVEDVPEHDLFTYSFPCQDISVAGHQKGIIKGETRSGLLWECERIIEAKRPKYLLMENVKALVGKKFMPDFIKWKNKLESLGYTNYAKVLNAKDYGIPQSRERIFMISILKEHTSYKWPVQFDNGLRLKDFLESEVNENYYVSEEKVNQLISNLHGEIDLNKQVIGTCHEKNDLSFATRNKVYNAEKLSPTLTATTYKDPVKVLQVGNYREKEEGFANPQTGRVYSTEGISPTLNTMQGGDRQPKVIVRQATKQGYDITTTGDSININQPNSSTRRGRVGKQICNTLTTQQEDTTLTCDFRIRKLTPRECFRLMGLKDREIDKIQQAGISNSQQYRLAGNSIVVDVLEAIFRQLFL